jgi:DNA-binding FadR family transcriptional regulator
MFPPDGERQVAVTLRIPKMAELVAAHLRRQIVRGELRDGDALPPEMILMEQFGVSRPTLREAFRILESEALLTVRRGARGGARVHPPNVDAGARYAGLVLQYHDTTFADIYEAQSVIEPQCAGLLAARRTREDLDRLSGAVERAGAVLDDEAGLFGRIDREFHALVVDLAGNETLKVLTGIVRHVIATANSRRPAEEPRGSSTRRAVHRRVRAHSRLVELVRAKDVAGAEGLWRRHLAEDRQLNPTSTGTTVLDVLD